MRAAVRILPLALALLAGASAGCFRKRSTPMSRAEQLAVGGAHACAVLQDKHVACWGDGVALPTVHPLTTSSPVVELAAGGDSTCARHEDGTVACWGALAGTDAPACSGGRATRMAVGWKAEACLVCVDGAVRCWGPELRGAVPTLPPSAGITLGRDHACVVSMQGTVQCWGQAASLQVGDGKVRGAREIAAGDAHTCVVTVDGRVECWGDNAHGQLGDGTTTSSASAVEVKGLGAARGVALGEGFSCARLMDGTLRCWGKNATHQLTNGTTADASEPRIVSGLFDVQEVGAGRGSICARMGDRDRVVRCWGDNPRGQVGDGTTLLRTVPVVVRFPLR